MLSLGAVLVLRLLDGTHWFAMSQPTGQVPDVARSNRLLFADDLRDGLRDLWL